MDEIIRHLRQLEDRVDDLEQREFEIDTTQFVAALDARTLAIVAPLRAEISQPRTAVEQLQPPAGGACMTEAERDVERAKIVASLLGMLRRTERKAQIG